MLFEKLFKGKAFAILTDQNPRHKVYAKRPLTEVLDLNGHLYFEVLGSYEGQQEKSYIVGCKKEQAIQLGRLYGQESILWIELYGYGGSQNQLIFCNTGEAITDLGYLLSDRVPNQIAWTKFQDEYITFIL